MQLRQIEPLACTPSGPHTEAAEETETDRSTLPTLAAMRPAMGHPPSDE
jgi:hypothetical protein